MYSVRKKSYHLLYFFLQPFFTVLYYLRNFRAPHAKNVMWLFAIFYGLTFAIGEENSNADIVRYMAEVPMIEKMDMGIRDFLFYYKSTGEFDILRSILAFTVALFTDNGFYLVIVYGIIYGFFFSRNMWFVLDRLEGKIKPFTRILLLCLFLSIPLWSMNGFRFWTAAHVFIYGLLPFLYEKKKKPLIWCFITPFVFHYSFLSALMPIVAYLILGNRLRLFYFMFIFSLLFSEINIKSFNKAVENYAPTALVERSSGYRDTDKVEELRESANEHKVWYARYYKNLMKYLLLIYIFTFYSLYKHSIKKDKELLRMLCFILLFFGFSNFFSSIPSGYRFMNVSNLLTLSFIALYYQNNPTPRVLYTVTKMTGIFFILVSIVNLRMSWYSFSVMTLAGNPLTAIFSFGENLSINDVIKGFLN